jgi:hypothetical protein
LFGRTKPFCVSAYYNCALNCTKPSNELILYACFIKMYVDMVTASAPVCSDADVRAGRWTKLYWDSEDDCGEGFDPVFWPGIMKNKSCCSGSQTCNAPGAMPPVIKCFSTKSTFSAGYCAGKTVSYSACAISQTRADAKAVKFAEVRSMLAF